MPSSLPATPSPPSTSTIRADGARILDVITLGEPSSEECHRFWSESSTVVDGDPGTDHDGLSGDPHRPARVALSLQEPSARVSDLRFGLRVDPVRQNFLTVAFWGEDTSELKTMVLVNGEQASYRAGGDYEPINVGTCGGLPGRFFYSTAMLPIASTSGQRQVEITLRTYSLTYRAPADEAGYESVTASSRRFFEAFTHTVATLREDDVDGRDPVAALPAPRPAPDDELAVVGGLRQRQIELFDGLTRRVDAGDVAALSINRYDDLLRYYAEVLLLDWCPAGSAAHKRAALHRVFATIDHFTREYHSDVRLVGTGGHQSDWGGYYSALGEALYIVENLVGDRTICGLNRFESFLDEPFDTGTAEGRYSLSSLGRDGEPLTRRTAWERVLKATFDFARSRLSYISNQVMYTYEGAWKAHEGLRVIGSRYFEGKERSHRIARESLGMAEFLGEEVLEGPAGEDLDTYHSLFHHDKNAVYTDDYEQIIMKGLARSRRDAHGEVVRRVPYGPHFVSLTQAGLMRENRYVGVYGESMNYLPCWFFRTRDHLGDEALNRDILRTALTNLHARGFTRYPGVDHDGHRVMYMQQVVDERNSDFPGRVAYGTDNESGAALRYVSLEHHMLEHGQEYGGPEWEACREYAREATGWAQQMLLDDQFFPHLARWLERIIRYDLRMWESYEYLVEGRRDLAGAIGAGRVLPHTELEAFTAEELQSLGIEDGHENRRFVWVDIENLFLTIRDGGTHVWANLTERNHGFAGNGRVHLMCGRFDQLLQVPTEGIISYHEHTLRGPTREELRQHAQDTVVEGRPFALSGELLPVAHQSGVGDIRRDNHVQDNPYSALADMVVARIGKYFVAVNTTRPAHENARELCAPLPAGYNDETVEDLVGGEHLPVRDGCVRVAPFTAVVLAVGPETGASVRPPQVKVVVATPSHGAIGLSWAPVPGADLYRVLRAPGDVVVEETSECSVVDTSVGAAEYVYTVTAVNDVGAAPPSRPVQGRCAGVEAGAGWSGTALGDASIDTVSASPDAISITGHGAGFGGGDDAHLFDRDRPDSLALVTRLEQGSILLTARLAPTSDVSGIIIRDSVEAVGRYAFLGTDGTGTLELKTRTLDSREDLGVGNPGQDAAGGEVRSPRTTRFEGITTGTHPYVRLHRDSSGHLVTALVSRDGVSWVRVVTDLVPMLAAIHAGVVTTGSLTADEIEVERMAPEHAVPTLGRSGRVTTLTWNKPKAAITFDVYLTYDAAVAGPVAGPGWERIAEQRWQTFLDVSSIGTGAVLAVVSRHADGTSSTSPHVVSVINSTE